MTHSYLDWQISTLMLAYDAAQPLSRNDTEALKERQQHCEREVHALAHAVIPSWYRENPQDDFPPEIVVNLTQATIRRAAEILSIV